MINDYIYALSIFISLIGAGVSIWSYIDTRKKYYSEYIKRKKESYD